MLKELWIYRALGCLVLVVILFHPLTAAARGECYDEDYGEGALVGGFVGAAAGTAVTVATGLGTITGVTVSAAAGTSIATSLGAGVIVGCATTMCIVPVVGGVLVGVGTALIWLAGKDPKDCAGTIYYSPKRDKFYGVYDRDSIAEAAEDGKEFCESEGGTCRKEMEFRKCAALARDREIQVYGGSQDRTAKEAELEALKVCNAYGGKNCTITLSMCNSG